jgi:DNA-binding NarL/FixJ family response regulator
MDAMVEHGHQKVVAKELGLCVRTVEHHCQSVGKRMRLSGQTIIKYILWDRWRRNGKPAEGA